MPQNDQSLLNKQRFLPLFSIQFLNAMNDLVLKNAILVLITYHGLVVYGLSKDVSVNIAALLFILPFFFFSSYAGKIADSTSKVILIKIIKGFELLIIIVASIGFLKHNIIILMLSLMAMGVHSTFFGPIKFSILPQYISENKKLLLANGFIEMGTFVAILFGQFLGSWYMAQNQLWVVCGLLLLFSFGGLFLAFCLEDVPATTDKMVLHLNVIRDVTESYKKVMKEESIRHCIFSISWFWLVGVIYTTQLPLFTLEYIGGSAHVFSVILAVFSVAVGIGSIVCSKVANGIIRHKFVIYGAIGMLICTILLIVLNHLPQTQQISLHDFNRSFSGICDYLLIFGIGFNAGFYSVTCYSELQIESAQSMLSQVMAINNFMNAVYMFGASLVCTILLFFINIWWVFILFIMCHGLFIIWYWRTVTTQPV